MYARPRAAATPLFGRELVPVLSLELRVVGLDGPHIGLQVSGRSEHRAQPAELARVVHIGHHDGYTGLDRYPVEARLPVPCFAARSLGGYHQREVALCLADGLRRSGHQVARLPPVDSDATEPAHQGAEGPVKKLLFSHPVNVDAQRERNHQRVGQIPVAGVWCSDQDAARAVGWQLAIELPAAGM